MKLIWKDITRDKVITLTRGYNIIGRVCKFRGGGITYVAEANVTYVTNFGMTFENGDVSMHTHVRDWGHLGGILDKYINTCADQFLRGYSILYAAVGL